MVRVFGQVLLRASVAIAAACGSGGSHQVERSAGPNVSLHRQAQDPGIAGLRAAADEYMQAWLTGSDETLNAVRGTSARPTETTFTSRKLRWTGSATP